MSLNEYLDQLRQALDQIDSYGFAESIEINQEVRSGKQATILIKVVLVDSSTLIIREYIDAQYKVEKLSYAYHYQAGDGNLIFRYDNAKHKPDLGYEEHKGGGRNKLSSCLSFFRCPALIDCPRSQLREQSIALSIGKNPTQIEAIYFFRLPKHTANGKIMHCESPDISELVNEVIKCL